MKIIKWILSFFKKKIKQKEPEKWDNSYAHPSEDYSE